MPLPPGGWFIQFCRFLSNFLTFYLTKPQKGDAFYGKTLHMQNTFNQFTFDCLSRSPLPAGWRSAFPKVQDWRRA
jgi:hypothetical protein